VGYGLEGILPDTLAKQVLDNIVKPELQAGNPGIGVTAGVEALMKITQGEVVDLEYNPNANKEAQIGLVIFVFMMFIFLSAIYNRVATVKLFQKKMRSKRMRGVFVGILSVVGGIVVSLSGFLHPLVGIVIVGATLGLLFFKFLSKAGMLIGAGGGGGYRSGRSGGGSRGGFGGFGGGSSGGGGASSSW